VPYLADDATVLRIFGRLPSPIRFVWLLTNRAGLRCGEACGLRLSDFDGMRDGAIRIRFNYSSPMLKEAKGTPKTKWVPAPSDLPEFIGGWLEQRRAEGAEPEALAFPDRDGYPLNKDQVGAAFRKVRDQLGLPRELTAHRSGRHSFASRLLAAGAGVTEVSSALGHADGGRLLMATYNHHVRKTWSPALVAPMQVGAKVLPFSARTASAGPAIETKEAASG
jgi:integrase